MRNSIAKIFLSLIVVLNLTATTDAFGQLPSPWQTADIGDPLPLGTASESNGVFTINGGGEDIWNNSDKFYFVYQSLSGDGEIMAEVTSIENTGTWAHGAVMIRESLAADSRHATMSLFPTAGGKTSRFKKRTSTGGSTTSDAGIGTLTYWIRLERIGDVIFGYESTNGINWGTALGSVTLSNMSSPLIGLAVASKNNGTLCQVIYDNVTVTGGPPTQPPAAPSNLLATTASSSQIDLSWNDNSNNEDGFKIERKQGGGSFSQIQIVGAGVQSFSNIGLSASTTYTYRVFSYNSAGNSTTPSNEFSATTNSLPQPPAAPSNLLATTASSSQIDLTWNDNSNNEDGFKIERKQGGGAFSQIQIVGAGVESFSDSGLSASTTYTYRVFSYNSAGNSASPSNESSATTNSPPVQPPTAPSNLLATSASSSQIDLTWNDNSNNEDGFKIERKQGGGSFNQIQIVGAGVESFSDPGLSASTTYTYRVFSYNGAGNSTSPSNESSAMTSSGGSGTWTVAGNDIYYNAGNVGIGTTQPDQALTVKGKIHTEEIIVNLSVPMADYVFEDDYGLMPLKELEQFVKTKKHLPGVPTAKNVEANGLSLGEMNAMLLEKIEELTLYVIALKKQLLKIEKTAVIEEDQDRIGIKHRATSIKKQVTNNFLEIEDRR